MNDGETNNEEILSYNEYPQEIKNYRELEGRKINLNQSHTMRTSSKCHQHNSELEELAVVLPNGYESFRCRYKRLYESSLFSLVAGEVLEVVHHRKIIMEIRSH